MCLCRMFSFPSAFFICIMELLLFLFQWYYNFIPTLLTAANWIRLVIFFMGSVKQIIMNFIVPWLCCWEKLQFPLLESEYIIWILHHAAGDVEIAKVNMLNIPFIRTVTCKTTHYAFIFVFCQANKKGVIVNNVMKMLL